jgi:predicted ATPase
VTPISSQDPRDRAWNRLLTTSSPIALKSLRIIESDVFEQQSISFAPATVIVGSHGAGKTLLLRLLQAAFGYRSYTPPFVGVQKYRDLESRPVTGVVEVTVATKEHQVTRIVDLSAPDEERWKLWAEGFLFYFQELDWGRDHVITERSYKAKELSALRNILGRHYESVTRQTISLDSETDSEGYFVHTAPYIIAEMSGQKFDSTMLSLGEFWVHHVLWEQDQLAEGCLLLLDEPESFLATRGHRPFIDEVARRSLDNQTQLIVATHSPGVLSRFPTKNMRMCVRGTGGKIRVIQPESLSQVRNIVGINIPTKTIALVEDAFAARILRAIFGHMNTPLAGIEVIPADGKSKVIAGVEILAKSEQIRFLGVLDADQRSIVKGNPQLLTLPGTLDPETELLDYALSHPDQIGATLGRTPDAVLAALDSREFLDHQYQPAHFADQLGLDEAHVVNVLVQLWLTDQKIKEQALRLVAELIDD